MKHAYYWFLLLLLLGGGQRATAQTRVKTPVYDQNGRPLYIQGELLVSFNPYLLNLATIDNRSIRSSYLGNFLQPAAMARVSAALGFDAFKLQTWKLHPDRVSADTLGVSINGDTVALSHMYANLVVILPRGISENVAIRRLMQTRPTVDAIGLNWIIQPSSQDNGALQVELAAFPNPAHERVSLLLPGISLGNSVVEVWNGRGQLVYSAGQRQPAYDAELLAAPQQVRKLDIALKDWPAGIYSYRVTTPEGRHQGRFQKMD